MNCKLCDTDVNGSGVVYCPICSTIVSLSVQPRREMRNAIKDRKERLSNPKPTRKRNVPELDQTERALEIWDELSEEAEIFLGAKIALFQTQTHARGMGAISVMELLVRLIEYGFLELEAEHE